MASSRMLKDPDEVRLLVINWRPRLQRHDVLTGSTWVISPTGQLTNSGDAVDQAKAATLLGAGDNGQTYEVTNRVTTQLGLSLEKTITVRVQNRVG